MNTTREPTFLADFMLGRLSRWLRILGFDASYPGDLKDSELLRQSLAEGRALLTRDRELARRAGQAGYLVEAEDLTSQLREVLSAFHLVPRRERLLSRCLRCNCETRPVTRDEVRDEVPPFVCASAPRFARCPSCRQIFWPATHSEGILQRLARQGIELED